MWAEFIWPTSRQYAGTIALSGMTLQQLVLVLNDDCSGLLSYTAIQV
jgi:hypothetical protein